MANPHCGGKASFAAMTSSGGQLAPREKECLRLVPELRTSKAIGLRLNLAPNTVDQYIKSAMRKLGVSDRFAASRKLLAAEQGGVDTPAFGTLPPSGHVEEAPDDAHRLARDHALSGSTARELPKAYLAEEPPRFMGRSFWGVILREEGGRNDLPVPARLRLCFGYAALSVLLFAILCVALLVLAASRRELFDP